MACLTGPALRRRAIRAAAIITIASTALGLAQTPALAAATFVEPVFGLLVDGAKARYLPLAPDVAKRCNLAADPWLVFASAKEGGGDLYIVQPASGDGAGAILRVSPAGCAASEASLVLSGQAPMPAGAMAQPVAVQSAGAAPPKALVDNAVLRAQQALGGPAAFKTKVCQPAVIRDIEGYPAVHARLATLCGL